jgi:hypothetical protein
VEGVRGRIDLSGPPQGITPGTDLYASLQSINDPAANLFTPDIVRVAKSLCPYFVSITKDTLLLCFPTSGKYNTAVTNSITITEGFARAFVDATSNNNPTTARVDSSTTAYPGNLLGAPTNNTEFVVYLRDIPASVSAINWQASVPSVQLPTTSFLVLDSSTDISSTGEATATYVYVSNEQTDLSDITTETFVLQPGIVLSTSNTVATGTINAGVYLAPFAETLGACSAPSGSSTRYRPRFVKTLRSLSSGCNIPPDESVQPYADIIRCNCYLLYTYVTATSAWNTGMVVANTSGDTAVFGTLRHAPDQQGPVTFYFYDKTAQYVGSTTTATDILPGQSLVTLLSAILPTTPTPVTTFSGYVIAKTSFQYCHGYAFIADNSFANIAQGYLANVIPDPSIKAGYRSATAAADVGATITIPAAGGGTVTVSWGLIPAGESLNN